MLATIHHLNSSEFPIHHAVFTTIAPASPAAATFFLLLLLSNSSYHGLPRRFWFYSRVTPTFSRKSYFQTRFQPLRPCTALSVQEIRRA